MLPNRIIMLLLIIASGVFVTFFGGVVPYTLFTLCLLLPLLSLLYLVYVFFQFRIYQYLEKKTLVKGENVPFRFILANEDILTYAHIQVTFLSDYSSLEQVDSTKLYTLLPAERVEHETRLLCRYRGDYKVGINKVILQDYLHLFQLTYKCPSPIEVHVLPRVLPLDRLFLIPPSEDMKQPPNAQTAQIPDIETRLYANGDPLRLIHWKASARTGQLLVRKTLTEPRPEQVIFLDLNLLSTNDYERIVISDLVIEYVLSIVNHYLLSHIPCTVLCHSGRQNRFPVNTREEFELFYRFCSQAAFRSPVSAGELLTGGLSLVTPGTSCMLLTTVLSPELSKACSLALSSGNRLSCFYFGDSGTEDFTRILDERVTFTQINTTQNITATTDSGTAGV